MSPRILVVDDDKLNLEVLVEMLALEHYLVSTATEGFEALAKIAAEKPDLVLLDLLMPDLDGFEVCQRVKTDPATTDVPVIMVTALEDVADLVRGFEAGADDFVTKPFSFDALMARVGAQLRRKRNYDHIRAQAMVDPLTGAFNRWYFGAHAPRLAARCHAARNPVAVLMIDIDDLKRINDANGHTTGDRVLKQLVTRVTSALRPSDLVARMGGDEFAVVMPETDLDEAQQIADRLRRRIGDTPVEGVAVTVSIGAAASRPEEEEELEVTLQRADSAVYEAKRAGGNRVVADESASKPPDVPYRLLGRLRRRLFFISVHSPSGDTDVDALIASTLDVPSHPYTSNDTYAQTLLPPGWAWSTAADGAIGCVRYADQLIFGQEMLRDRDSKVVSDQLVRCIVAIEAHRQIAWEMPGSTRSPLGRLFMRHLVGADPNGDPAADAAIASTLGVPPLPYTADDDAAQTLIPSGWSWGTTAAGSPTCVRDADGFATGGDTYDGQGNIVSIPSPLARCLAAVGALRLIEWKEWVRQRGR